MSGTTYTATIIVCRVVDDEDVEIKVTVEGRVYPPEPDVGIFGWWSEPDTAKDADGRDVKLTDREWEEAGDALVEAREQSRYADCP